VDIRDYPLTLRVLGFFRNAVLYLFVLGVALACLASDQPSVALSA
jgi:hypothetical protein